jgi:hypothetical protein
MNKLSQISDYNQVFNQWYNDSNTDDALYEILVQYKKRERQVELLKSMLQSAFGMGLRTAAQDSVDTLQQYATACAGLSAIGFTPEQKYDDAADSLLVYFTKALDNFDKEK